MSEKDASELADARAREADELQEQSERLRSDVQGARDDWRRKRADQNVPGAPPLEGSEDDEDDEEDERESPAPQAPPEGAGPSQAEMPPEGKAGPPADSDDGDS